MPLLFSKHTCLSLRFLSPYFLHSRFEQEVSETDTRLAGFSGFWHFWLFQIVFHQTSFFSCSLPFQISIFPWCQDELCVTIVDSSVCLKLTVTVPLIVVSLYHSTFTLMIMAPFSPNVKYHILFCFMCLKQFCNKNVL